MRLCSGRTRSASAPGISWSSISTTVTLAPSAWYTVAISRPMMPPPMTRNRPGTSSGERAPVESMMRGSSGRNGSFTALEPAAMMQLSNVISRPSTAIDVRPGELRDAGDDLDLALLGQHRSARPSACRRRPASKPISFGQIDLRLAERDPVLSHLLGLGDRPEPRAAAPSTGCTRRSGRPHPSVSYCSTSVTFRPRSAALKAAVYPPGPEPMTTTWVLAHVRRRWSRWRRRQRFLVSVGEDRRWSLPLAGGDCGGIRSRG